MCQCPSRRQGGGGKNEDEEEEEEEGGLAFLVLVEDSDDVAEPSFSSSFSCSPEPLGKVIIHHPHPNDSQLPAPPHN